MVDAFISILRRQRQVGLTLPEFKASLVYRVSSKTVGAAQRKKKKTYQPTYKKKSY